MMPKVNTNASIGRLGGAAFAVAGTLIALVGIVWLVRTALFVNRASRAPGQVMAMERSEGTEGGSVYHPLFKFADAGGILHTQLSSHGSSDLSFEVGEKVTILYDPAAPKHSRIESFQTVWLAPLSVTGFGLLFGGFAWFWLFLWCRAARAQGV